MRATGFIFAALDCDADCIEEFNRWYDVEHLPPNVSMNGVMQGRRYVATPELHAVRVVDPASGFAGRRGTFLTMYTLCGDPADAFADMTVFRDEMYASGRMTFPADKKAVREGDVMPLVWAQPDPKRSCVDIDVPFLGHTGVIVVQHRGPVAVGDWYRHDWAPRVGAVAGVHGVMGCTSATREGLRIEFVLVEGDLVAVTAAVRAAASHHPEAEIVLDAPFALIDPLRYDFAEAIRASDLPRTIA